jgi:hypothetical protein
MMLQLLPLGMPIKNDWVVFRLLVHHCDENADVVFRRADHGLD